METNNANSYLYLDPDRYDYNPSLARGWPCSTQCGGINCGWISGALNVVNTGTGYYHYNPEKVRSDAYIDTDDWGVLHLINMVESAGRDWYDYFMTPPRIGVGDMSLRNGGEWDDHSSHENGLDVDVRYVRKDDKDSALNVSTQPSLYDTTATLALMRYMVGNGSVSLIILSPYAGIFGEGVIEDTTAKSRAGAPCSC